jgi:hypothetical protein
MDMILSQSIIVLVHRQADPKQKATGIGKVPATFISILA